MNRDLELKLTLRATDQGLVGTVREAHAEVKDFSEELDAASDKSKTAAHQQDKLASALGDTGKQAEQTARSQADLAQSTDKTADQAKRADHQVGGLNKTLDKNAGASKKAKKGGESFTKTMADGAIKAAAWATAVISATTAVVGFVTTLNTDAIRETDLMAQTLGTSTQVVSEWQYATEQAMLPADKLGDIFKDVSDKLGDFVTTGGGEAVDLFENLNIKAADLVNLSPDQQLLAIGEALDEVGNRGQKIFFLEALADDASRLLPLLENDAAELKRLRLEAQVLGVSISDIDAAKVAQAGAAMERVKGLIKGQTNALTIELAPVLAGIADMWVDNAVEAGGYRDTVREVVDGAITGLGFTLDVLQQYRVWLKHGEIGFLTLGQAGTSAMASVADSTAMVINTVMYPFQKTLAWIIDKYAYLVELGASFGGPFADEFEAAAKMLHGFSVEVDTFTVSAEDLIALNERMGTSLISAADELEALLNADASSDQLRATLDRLRKESDAAAAAQAELRKQTSQTTELVGGETVNAYKDLVEELEGELALIGLTNEEREIEISLRKLGADATDEQRQKIRQLTGSLYDYRQEQKKAEQQAKAWQTITDNALNSVDDSFRQLFRSGLDGWSDFWDQMKNTAKDMLAELAYTLVKQQLWVNVGFNVTGQAGAAAVPGASGLSNLSNVANLGNLSNLVTGNSIGQGIAGLGAQLFGTANNPALVSNVAAIKSGAVSVSNPLGNMAGVSNLAMIGGGLGGSLLSDALGLSGEYSGITGAAGTLAGAALLTPVLGPFAPLVGSFLGSALGGLFGGKPSDKTQGSQIDLATGRVTTEGGATGDKFSQENLDMAQAAGQLVSTFSQFLAEETDKIRDEEISFLIGNRDGLRLRIDGEITETTNSAEALLQLTTETLADLYGFNVDYYETLRRDGELLADAVIRIETQFDYLSAAAEQLNLQFTATGDAGLKAADDLMAAAGGLEAFQTQAAYYYENFYTQHEREQQVLKTAADQVAEWNAEIGLAGEAAINSRAEFRQYIEALDLTTAAGQQAWASAMQLAGAIVTLEDAIGGSALAGLEGTTQDWITERAQQIADHYRDELANINSVYRVRQQQLQAELAAANQLRQAVNNLRLSDISPLTADQRVNTAQAEFARLQVLIESGNLDAASQVGNAAQAYLAELSASRGADPYYVEEFNDVTDYLEQLGISLGSDLDPLAEMQRLEQQMLVEQRALAANSRAQLDLLAKQYAELVELDDSLSVLGDLLSGLPSDIAAALQGIVSAAQGGGSSSGGSSTGGSTGSSGLSDYDFINQLYNQGLNREADTGGFDFWMGALQGGLDREQLKDDFFEGAINNGETVNYFASGGVVTGPQRFSYDREISGLFGSHTGEAGEANAEAIIPVGNGFIPAKFDSSLISEIRALRQQNAAQAQQLAELNSKLQRLTEVTDGHGKAAQRQRDKQVKVIARTGRKTVETTV